MLLTGAQIVLECLKEQGVDTVFGYPGGTILNIYDALYHEKSITHILTSHEQGAAHAADGYARASGKTGVCFATSGPGSTNLVTGIATAYMDSVPVVAITCNVGLPLLGKDTFQEVDINGITMPITKHGFIVKDVRVLADTIRRAFHIAANGRPGPVIVDITKDVTAATCEFTVTKPAKQKTEKKYTEEDIRLAARMIEKAKRPFLYVGGGAVISGASAVLKRFAETADAPVCDTLMGKGAFDGNHPLYTGMIGMHGTKASNLGVSKCDLLIALGARFSDRVVGNVNAFAKGARILHIDIDAAEIGKNVRADHAITGDLKQVLTELTKAMKPLKHASWVKEIAGYKTRFPLAYPKDHLTTPYLIESVYELTKGNAVITTDVGQHQMWTAQYYRFSKPRTFLTSGGLGTMGFGLGACIGAKMARPDAVCINITGDGCFRMNMQELATASTYGIPVIDIISDNGTLGMVRQWQTLMYKKHYSQTTLSSHVDYCKVAEGLGCAAIRVTKKEEVKEALKKALHIAKTKRQPVVIDCVVGLDDSVFPFVPPGASIADAFDAEDLKKKHAKR
ncbi:MAG: biosynthetic-type acetolactate synthase large subunit [Lachnospiraceae bacterium]|nr:biosynthetic-type acetolactate synthase large subunit [Lachnospiraceae bacterium]